MDECFVNDFAAWKSKPTENPTKYPEFQIQVFSKPDFNFDELIQSFRTDKNLRIKSFVLMTKFGW